MTMIDPVALPGRKSPFSAWRRIRLLVCRFLQQAQDSLGVKKRDDDEQPDAKDEVEPGFHLAYSPEDDGKEKEDCGGSR